MATQIKQFSFAELVELDGGRIRIAMDQLLKMAALDCEDRPGEKKARKINFQMELKPVLDQDGMCEDVKVVVQMKSSLPTRKSREYEFGLRRGGMLTFNPDAPDAHDQGTFDFNGKGEGEEP
jgi:hypothetical protein